MQLIDIVLLVLVGFIALSLIIFLFSYIGYRTRTKKINDGFKQEINDLPIIPDLEEKSPIQFEPENVKDPVMKDEPIKPNNVKNTKSKFEVFKPKKDNERAHNPKTIISSFPKEQGKKK